MTTTGGSRARGIRACVDMKQEGADPWGFEAFLWLPTPDLEPPPLAHLRIGLAFLRECEAIALPVFVTCMAGVGRSSTSCSPTFWPAASARRGSTWRWGS